ncbi:methionine aminopeptidase 1a, putative, partial [Plasmodium reichenowi]
MSFLNKSFMLNFLNTFPKKGKFQHTYILTPKLNKSKLPERKTFKPTLQDGKYKVTASQKVPEHIKCPSYAKTGIVENSNINYEIKDDKYIEKMKKACKLASDCLKLCLENSKEGITTDIIDNMAYDFYIKNNAYPGGLNFHSFPKSICASPNE